MRSCFFTLGIIIILSFILLLLPATAQQRINEDSLLQLIRTEKTSQVKIKAHNQLARFYMSNDSVKALLHLGLLDSLALLERDTTALIMASDLRLRYYATRSKFDKAEAEARWMLKSSIQIGRNDYISNSYNALGVIKSLKNEYDSVLFFLDTSYQLKKQIPDFNVSSLSKSLNNLAATAIRFNKYEQGLAYYYEALELAQKSNNPLSIGMIYNNLGTTHLDLEDIPLSRSYFRKAVAQAKQASNYNLEGDALHNLGGSYKETTVDSALYYYSKAIKLYQKIGRNDRIGLSTMAIGDVLTKNSDLDEALNYYLKALKIFTTINDKKRIIDSKNRLAKVHYELGDYKFAITFIDEVVTYYDDQNDLKSATKAYRLKSKILEGLGKNKNSIKALQHHIILKDSLNKSINNKEVATLKTKFETEIKESEISRQQLIINQQNNQKRDILIGSTLLALLLLSIIWNINQKAKRNKSLSQHRLQLQSQRITKLEQEKKLLSMNALIAGQEAERTRIAKDLHDGLGGLLSTVKAHFSSIQSEIQKVEKLNVYNRANEMMDQACDEVRRISHNLMPGALMLEGLKTAVVHLGEEMQSAHPFVVNVELEGFNNRMDENTEVFLYRIIQEALNNIIKHANAKNVLVQITETSNEYHLIIEDDGNGFDPLIIKSGLGLKSIQSRVDFLNGVLDIDTKETIGTTLTIHLPKENQS